MELQCTFRTVAAGEPVAFISMFPGYSVCVALELPWRASGWLSLREYGFPVGTWFHWVIDGRTFYTLGELQVVGLMCLTCWC